MKWESDPESQHLRRKAVVLSDRLRERAGWPVPHQSMLDVKGYLFVIQEFLDGTSVRRLTHRLVDRLVDLHSQRLGLVQPEDDSRWPDPLIDTLVTGGTSYCLHEPLRTFDQRARGLIERLERFGAALNPEELQGSDVVHWDFYPGNMLEAGGRLCGVIDTDFVTTGDAAFDLVTLAVTSQAIACEAGVRDRLSALAFDGLDETRRQAYVGHLLIRLLDWSIRRGRTEEIEFWLTRGVALLSG